MTGHATSEFIGLISYLLLFLGLIYILCYTIYIFQEYEIVKDTSNNNYSLYCISIVIITLISISLLSFVFIFASGVFFGIGMLANFLAFIFFIASQCIDRKNINLVYCSFITCITSLLYVIVTMWIITYVTGEKKSSEK